MWVSPPYVASNCSTSNNHKLPKPNWYKNCPITPLDSAIETKCKQSSKNHQTDVYYELAETDVMRI